MNSNIVHASLRRRAVRNISSCYHGSIWLLIICGDVELNPGPARQADIFTCGYCELAVCWSHQGVCCNNCSLWFHGICHSMSLTEYGEIGDRSWKCYRCRSHISDTFHSYELDSQTQLPADSHAVNERVSSVSSAPSPGSFHPQSHSSPLTSNGTPLAAPPSSILFSSLGHTHDSSDATTHPPSHSRNWRSMVINVNSVVNKQAEFEAAVDHHKPDAIFMSETKLNDQIARAEFMPPGYHAPLRKDRNRHGGGRQYSAWGIRKLTQGPEKDHQECPVQHHHPRWWFQLEGH